MTDYKSIIPIRFWDVSYETDVPGIVKQRLQEQLPKGNGLYLYGETGIGKTHIVCALIKDFLEKGLNVRFLNTGAFLENLREEFGKDFNAEGTGLFKEIMDFNKGILIFDDIGAEKATEWTRERIYLILNKKYEDMTPVIFTSNCDMEILSARMGDRITSRIAGMTTRLKLDGRDRRLDSNSQTNL